MKIIVKLYLLFFAKFVGKDEWGNFYYARDYKHRRQKRYVFYKGIVEPTKVASVWYRWLHYTSDKKPSDIDIINENISKYRANLTGTKQSYKPTGSILNKNHTPYKKHYDAWHPNQ